MSLDNLDRIALEAGEGEADEQAKLDAIENPPPPEPLINPAESWAQIPFMVGGLLSMAMPELKEAYTPAACLTWGESMHLVAQKYEWDAAETMSKWAPDIGLLMASLPLVLPTIAAIKARRELTLSEKAAKDLGGQWVDVDGGSVRVPEPGGFVDPH